MKKLRTEVIILASYQALLFAMMLLSLWIFKNKITWNLLCSRLSNFDGAHYLTLAREGYTVGPNKVLSVFMPFWPLMIRWMTYFVRQQEVATLILSNFFFALGNLFFLKNIRKLGFSESESWRIFSLFAVSPAALYFCGFHTEGLYWGLVNTALYLLLTEKFLAAAILGALISMTRQIGFTFAIPLFGLMASGACKTKPDKKSILQIGNAAAFAAFSTIGLALYLLINYWLYDDLFFYQKCLEWNWYKTLGNPLVNLATRIMSGDYKPNHFLFEIQFDPYKNVQNDQLATLGFVWLLLFYWTQDKWKERCPLWLWLWGAAQALVILSPSFWASNLRYLSTMPVAFILLGLAIEKRRAVYIVVLIFASSLLAQSFKQWALGQWIY